ncbi:P-loop containing nucleoside triphosphate hydrolase protein [Patellaria atrata CBS 101060]|uniref:Midasin n=1 Tax=Patellaria atrata CBS 101060 TaxID=1346257 RepID=A0A9P4S697_9PEZI|nr:P-loop containing nucleoside triphosphate hydrolase protein [Patellaria atrata CBS 101060]
MDITSRTEVLLSRPNILPAELLDTLHYGSNVDYLLAVAGASLQAQWLTSQSPIAAIAAFGRIIPFAPHLTEYAEHYCSQLKDILDFEPLSPESVRSNSGDSIEECLLGIYRLVSFDNAVFARYIKPSHLQALLAHQSRPIRYLAIRILCLYLHASDSSIQSILAQHLNDGDVTGSWEGKTIDYRFLGLWEEKRSRDILLKMKEIRTKEDIARSEISPLTAEVSGVLLPRLSGPMETSSSHFNIVQTSTTVRNLEKLAEGLISGHPLLLTGLPGSGKTSAHDKMITLHLNEQSDAKLLIGMYTTTKPGSFTWTPGVLTTAIKEGRWVFIEDLDRAPNEVISTLLPLMENNELLIPSRGETVRAARGFKIIATMRLTKNLRGEDRFWKRIHMDLVLEEELQEIVGAVYPLLKGHINSFLSVHRRLQFLYGNQAFLAASRTGKIRSITPRDLFKWCTRVSKVLSSTESFTSTQQDEIFIEGVDCYVGSIPSSPVRDSVIAAMAEELHIDPQRRDHLLSNRLISISVFKKDSKAQVQIGRVRLRCDPFHTRRLNSNEKRAFALSNHSLQLLEKVAAAVNSCEPLLLVGETGTGKTTCIQHLADQLGRKLVPFNLSQQSESGDLLGGFKPVNIRSLVIPLKDEFDELFGSMFSKSKNQQFLERLGKAVAKGHWKTVCKYWAEALRMVESARVTSKGSKAPRASDGHTQKKRRVDPEIAFAQQARWSKFAVDVKDLEAQLIRGGNAFAFTFVEGNIIKAARNGDWILLDEINLASPDTLEALADLLVGGDGISPSILLTETGNAERIRAHPNFRVFAAMNPATDVGKKDLPSGIRSRFTEIYVESPDRDPSSLLTIVESYLGSDGVDATLSSDVTNLYLRIQNYVEQNMLVDGANQKPHFSLRTLTRTLTYAMDVKSLCSLRRGLYEGFQMSFLTFLDKFSENLVAPVMKQYLFSKHGNANAELKKPLREPTDGRKYVQQGHYWLRQGAFPIHEQPLYIITPFIRRNLDNLIRAASTRRFPVLIQGPTSSGKTSMIEYLAKRSGNKFVRINNHEHTDLQEYLGTYVSDSSGQLYFQEGVLVRALREGHWVVLDELNLAPTDILEALNRLLDDNRELLIPETQEVVRPHPDFMLFATQNPAGLYGGRKVLSRAFRNRFLELHFDDIPVHELTEILQRRTSIPESWARRIVEVYRELSALRQENRIFEQKSFATLRDLFRWAMRNADTVEQLAINGYMLLAERVRKIEERLAVKKIIEDVMSRRGPRIRIDEALLYQGDRCPELQMHQRLNPRSNVVWTKAMRRLFVLVAHALRNNEPVLLVGETGCGKTTVCQLLADASGMTLHIVNAHQNTETGDLIGAQRPIRNHSAIETQLRQDLLNALGLEDQVQATSTETVALLCAYDKLGDGKSSSISPQLRDSIRIGRTRLVALFEWADGSLVNAMKTGQYFLLDEISLADDSVLERLNSVLESQRTLLLAEKGPVDSHVVAVEGFQFLATMNPGGDYGKRELSPALRNRFTEIWVPALSDADDIVQIVTAKLAPELRKAAPSIVAFSQWFNQRYNTSATTSVSIRDTLAWVHFMNTVGDQDIIFGLVHGAAMVFIDTLGANPAAILSISSDTVEQERRQCLQYLDKLLVTDTSSLYFSTLTVNITVSHLSVGSFSIAVAGEPEADPAFTMGAPTTRSNAMRVIRALQLPKPILVEGNPGVGKTTLITAIAKAIGKRLVRINLAEQTDLMDLFGSDAPVEGTKPGSFAWRDGPFLRAMKNGYWVLLDEMNLASQSVLEGLNACLDHRGEVYLSELDQTFSRHPEFRVFAAQNPHNQGGGRKGLPASFVNRFTVVYADVFKTDDLMLICKQSFPDVLESEINTFVNFVSAVDNEVVRRRSFGSLGSPWEFNLRDTLRWINLMTDKGGLLPSGTPRDFLDTVFTLRFRSESDRAAILNLYSKIVAPELSMRSFFHNLSTDTYQVGLVQPAADHGLVKHRLQEIESMMICTQKAWPVVLVGPSGSGKTQLIKHLAAISNVDLITFSLNADTDAMDLVGGYEQVDPSRQVQVFLSNLRSFVASTELLGFLRTSENLLEQLAQSNHARFEWVDGLLVRALERGDWLVLDNANLCSPSVLDRLNSLLEPNGHLSLNEHTNENGEARVIKPHPGFRIFLTMDPRYEVFLLPSEAFQYNDYAITGSSQLESMLYRFREFITSFSSNSNDNISLEFAAVALDHLSPSDINLLPCFVQQILAGLVDISNPQVIHMVQQSFSTIKGLSIEWQKHFEGLRAAQSKVITSGLNSDFGFAQSIHALNNYTLTRYNPYTQAQSVWLADSFELHGAITDMDHTFEKAVELSHNTKSPTRLQRSILSGRIPNAKNDSTIGAASFLKNTLTMVKTWLESTLKNNLTNSETEVYILRFCQFWRDLFQFVHSQDFNEASFQVYLKLGVSIVSSNLGGGAIATNLLPLSREMKLFGSFAELETGLDMEKIWVCFRPVVPSTYDRLQSLIKLEDLADRFNTSIWQYQVPLEELCRICGSLRDAMDLILSQDIDASGLINGLENFISSIETKESDDVREIEPFFTAEFENLSRLFSIQTATDQLSINMPILRLLAKRPIRSSRINEQAIGFQPWNILSQVSDYRGEAVYSSDISPHLPGDQESLFQKLANVASVPLRTLHLLQTEVGILGSNIASNTHILCRDELQSLNATLESLQSTMTFRDIIQTTELTLESSGWAWVQFGVGALLSFVPDRPFDPALQSHIERELFVKHRTELELKLNALKLYEKSFNLQEWTFRIQRVEQKLSAMGNEPSAPKIARPLVSELSRLQGEFTNLLHLINDLSNALSSRDASAILDQTLQQNLAQIYLRLSHNFRAYDDITLPAVGFLDCVSVGCKLLACRLRKSMITVQEYDYLCKATPFLGLAHSTSSLVLKDVVPGENTPDEFDWHVLERIAVQSSIEPLYYSQYCTTLHHIFANFYIHWQRKLQSDQVKAATDSSLYRYRGGQADEDEADQDAFNALFPDYEAPKEAKTGVESLYSAQVLAIKLSNVHAEIFLNKKDSFPKLRSLILNTAEIMSLRGAGSSSVYSDASRNDLLPAILLALENESASLRGTGAPKGNYNIYTDPNISEAQNLVHLVHRIQQRFKQLRAVWPEHATLGEVLRLCEELLSFQHVEPVAKLLTKTEKLHEAIHEWQRVASKEYSAANIYNDITALLVSWRQLELSTWARLFDIEVEKCTDDAKSWWFVAYENIIALPESLTSSVENLQEHTVGLLETLESFFRATSLGQYHQRLMLLRQFQEHLFMRVRDEPALTSVHVALSNFIIYFSYFERSVKDSLQKERSILEKDINNLLCMASWRDTNIDALRQSAKKSHKLLFKLVRKFRAVLARPVESLIQGAFPDIKIQATVVRSTLTPVINFPDSNGFKPNEELIAKWVSRPARFKNIQTTTSMMYKMSQPQSMSFDPTLSIRTFADNLEESITQLQKATPMTLTEENKPLVKNLKTRKRVLFAEVLKSLRQMGFKSNPSSNVLSKQKSLASVLASTPVLPSYTPIQECEQADYFLLKALHIMPRVREIPRGHSEDIASNEVAKSIGLLENILGTMVKQRNLVAKSISDVKLLEKTISRLQAVSKSSNDNIHVVAPQMKSTQHGLRQCLAWLSSILEMGIQILSAQSRLGNLPISLAIDNLQQWSTKMHDFKREIDDLPLYPPGIESSQHEELRTQKWEQVYPATGCIIRHIRPWAEISKPNINGHQGLLDTSGPLNEILESVQNLNAVLKTVSASEKDSAWMINTNKVFENALRTLSEQLQNLTTGDELNTVAAILFTVLPIFQQYRNIVVDCITRSAALHSKSFVLIAQKGFCTPSEKSDNTEASNDKLEGGTGLGEGEGAEDISKDIKDDEYLGDLAQEHNKEEDAGSIQDEQDAVNMGDQEMEGELGDKAEDGSDNEAQSGDESEDDMDEEAGDVDDLSASALDEKLWDDGKQDAKKDKKADDAKGSKNTDEQQEEEEEGNKNEMEGENLDLPEELELDDGKSQISDDSMMKTADNVQDEEHQESNDEEEETKQDGLLQDYNDNAKPGEEDQQQETRGNRDSTSAAASKQDDTVEGDSSEQTQAPAKEGQPGQTQQQDQVDIQPFKKLGDALEQWYNQNRQIRDAGQDMADADFEHLPDQDAKPDAQALGTAENDQAKTLDESKALQSNEKEPPAETFPNDENNDEAANEDTNMTDGAEAERRENAERKEGIPNTFINYDQDAADLDDSDIESVDEALSTVHLNPSEQAETRSPESARALWNQHESSTRTLSPTLATKLRGDFRTGKRLNIKKIIPYIASHKRSYQIMLAVDDSKIAKSLSMLEAGEICVVGFGEDVKVAHPFDHPFTNEAGVEVFKQFGEARMRSSGNDGVQAQEERIMIVFVIVDAAVSATTELGESRSKRSIMDLQTAEFGPDEKGEMKLVRRKYIDTFPFRWFLVVRDVRDLPGVLATALKQWFSEVVDSSA